MGCGRSNGETIYPVFARTPLIAVLVSESSSILDAASIMFDYSQTFSEHLRLPADNKTRIC